MLQPHCLTKVSAPRAGALAAILSLASRQLLSETPAKLLPDRLPEHGSRVKPAQRHAGFGMLRQVLLLQRDVPKAARFYQQGLGLKVKVLTERWAELDAGPTTLALKAVEGYEKSNTSRVRFT